MLVKNLIEDLQRDNFEFAKKLWNKNKKGPKDSSPDAYAFIVTVLKIIFDFHDQFIEKKNLITDGNRDGGIDAIHFIKSRKTIYILDVKRGKSKPEYKKIENFLNSLEEILLQRQTKKLLDALNERIKIKIKEARKCFTERKWKLKILIARELDTAGKINNQDVKKLLDRFSQKHKIDWEYLDCNNLIDEYTKSEPKRKKDYEWHLEIEKNNLFKTKSKALVGKVKIARLVDLIKKFNEEKRDLFDKNVRTDQNDKGLSVKIIDTLKRKPKDFYIYHNGITMSCSKISPRGNDFFYIHNPQIINGCQSLKAIEKAFEGEALKEEDIKDAYILCKIFSLEEEKIEAVCQSTNTQRKIEPWDLRSNDKIQKILEETLRLHDFNYSRKRSGRRKEDEILITDLGQWICSCELGKPAKAKTGKRQLFDVMNAEQSFYYQDLFNEEKLEIDIVKDICGIGLLVRNKIREAKENEKSFLRSADFHIMASLYKVKDVEGKKYKEILELIKRIADKVKEEKGEDYSYGYVFKNEDTWPKIEKELKEIK